MATVLDIVVGALQEIGVLAAGEVPTAAEADSALSTLNDLIDQWAAERLQIYTTTRTTWTIVSGTQNYTLGTGGNINVARPIYIDHINFVNTEPTIPIEYKLTPLTDDAWSNVPQKTLTSPFPTCWYYNPTFPLGTVTFWPVPTSTLLQGALYAPEAVTEFSTLQDSVALPPGYRRMMVKNLATCLAASYERDPRPALLDDAKETVAAVKRSNKRLMDMSVDLAALGGSRGRFLYNINTGP